MMSQAEKNTERLQVLECIKTEMELILMHSKLCHPVLSKSVYKYQLHGGIDAAIEKLYGIITQLENYPTSSETYDIINQVIFRIKMYNDSIANDPYELAISDAIKEGNDRKKNVMLEKQRARIAELHNKKECVCYS